MLCAVLLQRAIFEKKGARKMSQHCISNLRGFFHKVLCCIATIILADSRIPLGQGKVYLSEMRKGNPCQLRFRRALGMVNRNGNPISLDRRTTLRVCVFNFHTAGEVSLKESLKSGDQRTFFQRQQLKSAINRLFCVTLV